MQVTAASTTNVRPMRTRTRLVGAVAALAALASLLFAPQAHADATCGDAAAPDEWPTFGHDLANTRTQPEPGAISTATVPTLQPAWSFTTGTAFGGVGDLNGTPIVSGGCVFLNTSVGDVIALDAATGTVVWTVHVPVVKAGLGGAFVSSPVVDGDTLYALVSEEGAPAVIALDVTDGTEVHRQTIIEGPRYYTNATPVVAGDLLLAGFSPAEGDPNERGGIAVFDIKHPAAKKWARTIVYSIPDADVTPEHPYAGGGIWTAPAVDTDNGYAYAGTSNPYSKKIEHPNTNAVLKIDINPRRKATFGTIVGSYKGLIEQYRQEVRDAVDPTCEAAGEDPNLQLVVGDSAPCAQLDLDFGASPNLFRDATGRLLIGDLQKAGVYHAADASTMAPVWRSIVGVSCPACNAAAWAFDGSLVGASSPVGTELAIGPDDGTPRWASPIADGTHYQSTSVAGGVAFTVDNYGTLLAFDAATGVPLLKRPTQVDAGSGTTPALTSAGVAIAGGRVIVAAGNTVVAYIPI
jgi:outer membrane protein assembly factor BamB